MHLAFGYLLHLHPIEVLHAGYVRLEVEERTGTMVNFPIDDELLEMFYESYCRKCSTTLAS